MNTFGLVIGFSSLLIIGFGFPLVIFSERFLGYLWWPYMMVIGLLITLSSLFILSDWLSALSGILGVTLIWGSTELKEQSKRAEAGWFPYNPNKIAPPLANVIKKVKAPHL